MVVEPPKVSEPPPVKPVPAVIVKLFDDTAPEATVKFVELNEATPFWAVLAFDALMVTVDPEPVVVMPWVGEPTIFKLLLAGVAVPEFSVKVVGTDPEAEIVIEFVPFAIEMPVPWVKVAAAGAPLLLPITTCPLVKLSALKADVPLVPEMTTPLVLNDVAPVPPPGTVAVPNTGLLVAPAEINGMPAAPGAAKPTAAVPSPSNTLYWVRVVRLVPP